MNKTPAERLGSVFRLVYRSRISVASAGRAAALEAIFGVARAKNADLGITGALLAWEATVVQVLEGPEPDVRGLFDTIRADGRHDDVTLLDADTAPDRVFPNWSMARLGDEDRADIPVVMDRDAGTAVPAPPAPDDPRQAVMLNLMREYAREDVRPL